jgi:hypothetical protein
MHEGREGMNQQRTKGGRDDASDGMHQGSNARRAGGTMHQTGWISQTRADASVKGMHLLESG